MSIQPSDITDDFVARVTDAFRDYNQNSPPVALVHRDDPRYARLQDEGLRHCRQAIRHALYVAIRENGNAQG